MVDVPRAAGQGLRKGEGARALVPASLLPASLLPAFVVPLLLLGRATDARAAEAGMAPTSAQATPAPPTPPTPPAPAPLDLDEALALGAQRGPGSALARAPRRSLEEATRVARPALPLPAHVQLYAGPRLFPDGRTPGLDVQVQALQYVPLRNLGEAREAVGRAQVRAVDVDIVRAQLDAALRAGLAWIAVAEAKAVLALRQTAESESEELTRLARARVASGAALPQEAALASGELALTRAGSLDGEGRLTESWAELRFAVGAPPDASFEVTGSLLRAEDLPPDAALVRTRAATHPELELARARVESARREASYVHAATGPELGLGAVYMHEGTREQVVGGMVSVPLPWTRLGAFETYRADAAADEAQERVALARAELAKMAELALHEVVHTRQVRDAFEAAIVPLRQAVRLTQVQYEAGTTDLTPVLLSRQRARDTDERRLRAWADVRRADLRLRWITGTLLRGRP